MLAYLRDRSDRSTLLSVCRWAPAKGSVWNESPSRCYGACVCPAQCSHVLLALSSLIAPWLGCLRGRSWKRTHTSWAVEKIGLPAASGLSSFWLGRVGTMMIHSFYIILQKEESWENIFFNLSCTRLSIIMVVFTLFFEEPWSLLCFQKWPRCACCSAPSSR